MNILGQSKTNVIFFIFVIFFPIKLNIKQIKLNIPKQNTYIFIMGA